MRLQQQLHPDRHCRSSPAPQLLITQQAPTPFPIGAHGTDPATPAVPFHHATHSSMHAIPSAAPGGPPLHSPRHRGTVRIRSPHLSASHVQGVRP
ncbi:hypothetical protein C8245_02030 [Paracidovorax avenae]|nr:hypothetical protein C8245_02030 [Paracidovorax avenae]